MTAKAKTSPKRPGRRLGIHDPEVLAMFNELAEMKYQQYLAEEEPKKASK
jgi:Mn-dependent DtxR family transcriptional regulator